MARSTRFDRSMRIEKSRLFVFSIWRSSSSAGSGGRENARMIQALTTYISRRGRRIRNQALVMIRGRRRRPSVALTASEASTCKSDDSAIHLDLSLPKNQRR